jgi:hypothetical protein
MLTPGEKIIQVLERILEQKESVKKKLEEIEAVEKKSDFGQVSEAVKRELDQARKELYEVLDRAEHLESIVMEELIRQHPSFSIDFALSKIDPKAGNIFTKRSNTEGSRVILKDVKKLTDGTIRPYAFSKEELLNMPEGSLQKLIFLMRSGPAQRRAFRVLAVRKDEIEVIIEGNGDDDNRSIKTITILWNELVKNEIGEYIVLHHTDTKGGREISDEETCEGLTAPYPSLKYVEA